MSLNFKDVMLLLGILDASAFEGGWSMDAIGLECAGIIMEVGSLVRDCIHVGDRVMATPLQRSGCFQKYIEAPHYVVAKVQYINMNDVQA